MLFGGPVPFAMVDGCDPGTSCQLTAEWLMVCDETGITLDVAIRPDPSNEDCPMVYSLVGSRTFPAGSNCADLFYCANDTTPIVLEPGCDADDALVCIDPVILGGLVELPTWFFGGETQLTVPTQASRWFGV